MWNYLFEIAGKWSDLYGERFFVQCNTREEAEEILGQFFWTWNCRYLGKYTDEEAEKMGFEIY